MAWNVPLREAVFKLSWIPPVVYIPCKYEKCAHVDCSFHAKTSQELYSTPPLSSVSGLLDVTELAILLENSPA